MSIATLDYLPLNEDTAETYEYLKTLLPRFEENLTFTESGLASQCWVWTKGEKVTYRNGDGSRTNARIRGLAYEHAFPGVRGARANLEDICGNSTCINPDHLTSPGWDFLLELEHLALNRVSPLRVQEALNLTATEILRRVNYYASKDGLTARQARAVYIYQVGSLTEQAVDAEDIEDAEVRQQTLAGIQQMLTEQQYTLNRRLKVAVVEEELVAA